MKKAFLYFYFILCLSGTRAALQGVKCDLVLKDDHLLSKGLQEHLSDYLRQRANLKLKPHIGSSSEMNELSTWICEEDYFLSHSDSSFSSIIQIEAFASQVGDTVFLDSIAMTIDAETISIGNEKLKAIVFPNFCNIRVPIKPIKAFASFDGSIIYIYIYGKTEGNKFTEIENSYLSKIVIESKKFIGVISVKSFLLEAYGWYNCPFTYEIF